MIHELANIEPNCIIGENCKIWAYSHIRSGAELGDNVIIGEGVYVGNGVAIGSGSKVQNNALVYEPAILESGVFIGPGAILTNDTYPRAINPDGTQKSSHDWTPVGVHVSFGASIGAGAICIAPVRIGSWAVVGSGSVVTRDVRDYALVVGVPAKQIGWVGEAGIPLVIQQNGTYKCPKTHQEYEILDGNLFKA